MGLCSTSCRPGRRTLRCARKFWSTIRRGSTNFRCVESAIEKAALLYSIATTNQQILRHPFRVGEYQNLVRHNFHHWPTMASEKKLGRDSQVEQGASFSRC